MWIWLGNVQIKVISTWSKGVVLHIIMIGGKEGERREREGRGKENGGLEEWR